MTQTIKNNYPDNRFVVFTFITFITFIMSFTFVGTTVTGPPSGTKLKGIDVDMHHISDTVMTLAAIAPLCDSPTTIRNVANIRIKE